MRTPRHIHERFLHFIWKNKYLAVDELKSLNGEPIVIVDIGVPNRDAGPDFQRAKVRIGKTLYEGDVEIHHDLADWQKHLHSGDPRYNRVVLHVVLRWQPRKAVVAPPKTQSGREVPTLVLEPFLTEPLRLVWQRAILDERRERIRTIKCYGKNDDVSARVIKDWIERLAVERMELKIRKFDGRLKELVDEHRIVISEPFPRYYDDPSEIPPPIKEYAQKDFTNKALWEQLLYEGFMEGLGYSKNQEPFLRLARNLTLDFLRQEVGEDEDSIDRIQAMLFGAAGFLGTKKIFKDDNARAYFRALQKTWQSLRKRYRREILHEADWQFFRLRPQNFPTVRLAAASIVLKEFLLKKDFFREIIQKIKSPSRTNRERLEDLLLLFSAEAAGYWTEHYTFDGKAHRVAKKLLGRERVEDILLNTVLPIALLYARVFKDARVRMQALTLYEGFPPSAENSILTTMEEQLTSARVSLNTSYLQQGVIQLHNFYCAEERCGECEIGKRVFGGGPSPASI
jgi:hypothetical protein